MRWITFQKSRHYVNLSRVDPEEIAVSSTWSPRYLTLPGSAYHYVLAVSLVHIHECSIIKPKATGSTCVKKVAALLHSQEVDWLIGCVGMLYDAKVMDANMFGWIMYFETKKEDHKSRLSNFISFFYVFIIDVYQLLDSPMKGTSNAYSSSLASPRNKSSPSKSGGINFYHNYKSSSALALPYSSPTSSDRVGKPILDFADQGNIYFSIYFCY
jgi:hypothetical protein